MTVIEQARKIRAEMDTVATEATDATASKAVNIYPILKNEGLLIKAGARINWNGQLKKANVDLWDTAQNTPEAAPALWSDIAYKDGYRIIPTVITASLAYSAGEIGYWPADGKFYKAKNNGTVWTPSTYLAAWEAYTP